jgi:hypothetical protein
MAKKNGKRRNMVLEHRLIMAKFLGRCLSPAEIIHHKNGIHNDNRIENLELISCAEEHLRYKHIHVTTRTYIRKLEEKINNLKEELKILREQVGADLQVDA